MWDIPSIGHTQALGTIQAHPFHLSLPPAVRVFPAKAYAFVNYADVGAAVKAMQAVDGLAIPQLTGGLQLWWLALHLLAAHVLRSSKG